MKDYAVALIGKISDEATRQDWIDLVPNTKRGTAKEWFARKHGSNVDTIQAVVGSDGTFHSAWSAVHRRVDATTAKGSVRLAGSARDYAGLRVEAVSDDMLIASTPWGDDRQVCIYRTAR